MVGHIFMRADDDDGRTADGTENWNIKGHILASSQPLWWWLWPGSCCGQYVKWKSRRAGSQAVSTRTWLTLAGEFIAVPIPSQPDPARPSHIVKRFFMACQNHIEYKWRPADGVASFGHGRACFLYSRLVLVVDGMSNQLPSTGGSLKYKSSKDTAPTTDCRCKSAAALFSFVRSTSMANCRLKLYRVIILSSLPYYFCTTSCNNCSCLCHFPSA